MERQSRLDAEWSSNTGRGKLTARQFQPVFERLVTELELNGLGKSEREMFLGYLRRVGNPWRAEIMKWRGEFPSATGGMTIRGPQTWREAHQVLIELERLSTESKAIVASISPSASAEDPAGGLSAAAKRRARRQALQADPTSTTPAGVPPAPVSVDGLVPGTSASRGNCANPPGASQVSMFPCT